MHDVRTQNRSFCINTDTDVIYKTRLEDEM